MGRTEEQYRLGLTLQAFVAAEQRFTVEKYNEAAAFAALGEALFWACACDDRCVQLLGRPYKAARRRNPHLLGVKWARNRFTHQQLLVMDHVLGAELDRARLNRSRLDSISHFIWADPGIYRARKPAHDVGRQQYVAHMQGRPVSDTMDRLREWLDKDALRAFAP